MTSLPRYRCHKIVHAGKIVAVEFDEFGAAKIAVRDADVGVFSVGVEWRKRFNGTEEDLGYYVVYEDGYASWSPSKPFEDGYTRIEAND